MMAIRTLGEAGSRPVGKVLAAGMGVTEDPSAEGVEEPAAALWSGRTGMAGPVARPRAAMLLLRRNDFLFIGGNV